MSLTVDVFLLGEDLAMSVLDPAEPGAELAGFESFRTTVWGSDAMRAVGARRFPELAVGDITVMPEEVPEFLQECTAVAANLKQIAPRDNPDHSHEWFVETIGARLANIRAAAERALDLGGGVVIW